jgi:hypothetical protein
VRSGPVVGKSVQFIQLRILQRHWHDHHYTLSDFGILNHFHRRGIDVSEDVARFEVLRECAFKLETRVSGEMAESYDFDSHVRSFFAASEFLHLARKAVRDETGSVGIPFVAVVGANPPAVRVAVQANKDGARSVASVVAALPCVGMTLND